MFFFLADSITRGLEQRKFSFAVFCGLQKKSYCAVCIYANKESITGSTCLFVRLSACSFSASLLLSESNSEAWLPRTLFLDRFNLIWKYSIPAWTNALFPAFTGSIFLPTKFFFANSSTKRHGAHQPTGAHSHLFCVTHILKFQSLLWNPTEHLKFHRGERVVAT